MIKTSQQMNQKQTQQQRLSPQQIQYIKLLQLPTIALEQRIQEELEVNPVLEEADDNDPLTNGEEDWESDDEQPEELEPVDQNEEIDWDEYINNESDYGSDSYNGGSYGGDEDWRDLPDPYHESQLEELEQQVSLLNFSDEQKLIAKQILGSLDEDGYFRREIEAVVDNIAFNHGTLTNKEEVEKVRKEIQRLDPIGIASRDLRDCLLVQLELMNYKAEGRDHAIEMLRDYWNLFEKKHFSKLKKKLDVNDEQLKAAFECVTGLDPKPGASGNAVDDTQNYIEPDFEVYYQPAQDHEEHRVEGDFVIRLNNGNVPPLRISPHYKDMWDDLKKKKNKKKNKETKNFIKNKIESAQWFIDSIRQRQNTLMNTMKTIVALQENYFKHGEGLKPMILKDIAERVNLDISTISRVVNGKYVQTHFGVFELKYFFSEGLETASGEEVSSREVKNAVLEIVDNENKKKPLSDQAIADLLKDQGYKVARRTVSKYREKLNIPVARLRKEII